MITQDQFVLDAAQWAARYAGYAAGAAWLQVGLSALAGFLLWRTLQATREAVSQATRSAEAAEHAVEITRKSAEAQLRAYMAIDTARVAFDEASQRIAGLIELKNTGQTPAFDMKALVSCRIRPPGTLEPVAPPAFANAGGQNVGTGVLHQLQPVLDGAITPETKQAIQNNLLAFQVFVAVSYRDAFDRTWLLTGAMETKSSANGLVFAPMIEGNGETLACPESRQAG